MSVLAGRTAIFSGGSRGIGLAIARELAARGANIALIAKTDTPHPDLPGTIHTAADELRALGADVLPIVGDIRDEDGVAAAVAQTVERFGGIDLCINNASALNLSPIGELPIRRFDLRQSVNVRGTYVLTSACLPHLRRSDHAHVVTEIHAEAARILLERPPATCTGNTFLVEDVLAEEGITDLEPYSAVPGPTEFLPDFFVDPAGIR